MRANKSGLLVFFLLLFTAGALARATLPFPEDLLQGEHGRSLREVLGKSTLERQMGGLRVYGDQTVFEYLSSHPDFAASLAKAAGVLKYTVERRGEAGYWANDHDGLTADFAILRRGPGQMVVYAKGIYKKGVFRIPGRVALVVVYSAESAGNPPYLENTVTGFVRLDSGFFVALARLFRPAVERRMDDRVTWFLDKANQLMARLHEDPESVLQGLPPGSWEEEARHLRLLLAPSPSVQTQTGIDLPETPATRGLAS